MASAEVRGVETVMGARINLASRIKSHSRQILVPPYVLGDNESKLFTTARILKGTVLRERSQGRGRHAGQVIQLSW